MGWLGSLLGRPKASPFLPLLMPATWPGGDGNDCCRRLFGSEQQVDQDPWVALAREDSSGRGIDIFPPGGLGVLSDVLGEAITRDAAEVLACGLLDEKMRRENLKPEPLGEAAEVFCLVYEDFAASFILHSGLLQYMEQHLGGDRLFVAIPTRAHIYFGGTPGAAVAMHGLVREVQDRVPAEARLTSALFMAQAGKLIGMGKDVSELGLTFSRGSGRRTGHPREHR